MAANANEFAWSVSINKSFKSCERDYYYHNYGSWEGWSPEANLPTRELYILKFLKTREDWKDKSVHDEIARVLKMLRAQNILFPKDKSVERLAAAMKDEFGKSRARHYRDKYGNPQHETALFEHEYRVEVSKQEWRKTFLEAVKCVENFHGSSILDRVKRLDKTKIIVIDPTRPARFVMGGDIITIKLDLAYYNGENVEVVDWKTRPEDTDRLLFPLYAMYINKVYKIPLENISTIEHDLMTGTPSVYCYTAREIDEVRDYIENDIRRMKSQLKDQALNIAWQHDYPRTEDESKCASCRFKRVCLADVENVDEDDRAKISAA